MKAINVSRTSLTLREVLELAGEDHVLLRTSEGRQYVLAEIDDFAEEVAKVRNNKAIMQMLGKRSKETAQFTLSHVREKLQGRKGREGKGNIPAVRPGNTVNTRTPSGFKVKLLMPTICRKISNVAGSCSFRNFLSPSTLCTRGE